MYVIVSPVNKIDNPSWEQNLCIIIIVILIIIIIVTIIIIIFNIIIMHALTIIDQQYQE